MGTTYRVMVLVRASSRAVRLLRPGAGHASHTTSTSSTPRVCIVGGGFGGLYTALSLRALAGSEPLHISLVEPNDRFVFLPLLYEVTVGEVSVDEAAPRFKDLLRGSGIELVQAKLVSESSSESPDPPQGEVSTIQVQHGDGSVQKLDFDRLVLATGSSAWVPESCSQQAASFYTLDDALRLQKWITELPDDRTASVCVVGAGPVGTELATTLKAKMKHKLDITLIEAATSILPDASGQTQRTAANDALNRCGVQVMCGTKVEAVSESVVSLDYNGSPIELAADMVLWTGGSRLRGHGECLGLPTNERGAVLTEATLQVQGEPQVFALGDAASCVDADGVSGSPTAQAAFQQADYVAHNLWRSLNGQQLLEYKYVPLGEMMTFGSLDGTVSALNCVQLDGAVGGAVRRAVYLSRLPTHTHRAKVALSWATSTVADAAGWSPSWKRGVEHQMEPLAYLLNSLGGYAPAQDALAGVSRAVKPLGEIVSDVQTMVTPKRR